jgi:hypothetical protein
MNLDEWHLVFISICIIVVLTACYPIVMTYLPSRSEPFLVLAIFGEEGMAEHYYPGGDSNIAVDTAVHWFFYLYNHMGEPQQVAVRVKLLNSTMLAPNSTSCSPSPAPIIYEIQRVFMDNETWTYPFSWSIEAIERVGDFVELKVLSINNEDIPVYVNAIEGHNFRICLELWMYNKSLKEFQFGWLDGDEMLCNWNQIWFNVTAPV